MRDALEIHRELLALAVPHEIVRLPRPVFSSDELPDCLGLPPEACLSVRMYDAGGSVHPVVATIVPAGRWPMVPAVLSATGARTLQLMPPERVNAVTDYAAGLVSPVLLPDHTRMLIDLSVREQDVVYVATGETGTALGIRVAELLRLTGARLLGLLTVPPAQRAVPAGPRSATR